MAAGEEAGRPEDGPGSETGTGHDRPPWPFRITAWEWLAVAVGLGTLTLSLRARANSTPCAFLTFALPLALVTFSRVERARAVKGARGLWSGVNGYAAGGTGKTPWLAAILFVAIPSTLLNLSNDHIDTISDTSTVIPTAVSLLTEGNTDLDEFLGGDAWWAAVPESQRVDGLSYALRRRRGHIYPAHPSGMVPFALPVVAAARLAGANLSETVTHLRLEKLTASAVGGLSLGVFFLLALRLVRPVPALVTTATLAVASGMVTTVGQNLWQHDGVVFLTLLVLLLEFRPAARWDLAAQGILCGFLPAVRLTSATFLVPFGLWLFARSPRRAVALVALAVLAWLPWAYYHQSIYGSPFGASTSQMAPSNWTGHFGERLAGVLVSPGRGLLTYQPWLLLALAPLLPAVRRAMGRTAVGDGPRGWEAFCLVAMGMEVAVASMWWCWWGGWCWGSRLVVAVVPLGALLCARPIAALLTNRNGRALVAALAFSGVLVQFPGVYTDSFRWNVVHAATPEAALWSWRIAPFLAPFNLPPKRRPASAVAGKALPSVVR